jgi:hypothetical protein
MPLSRLMEGRNEFLCKRSSALWDRLYKSVDHPRSTKDPGPPQFKDD